MGEARRGGGRGERHVHPLGGEAGIERAGIERAAAGVDGLAELVAQLVEGGATGAALVRRGAAEFLQQRGQAAGFAEDTDPDGIERAQVGGGGEGGVGFGADGV